LKELIVCHEKILGEGGFGKVYQGIWLGKDVAIKQIPLFKVKVQEEEALESLDHPNVIKLFYAESNSHFR
jgi:serine/threonine protein kinase